MIFSPENILFQNKNISNHHEKHSQLEKNCVTLKNILTNISKICNWNMLYVNIVTN